MKMVTERTLRMGLKSLKKRRFRDKILDLSQYPGPPYGC